LLGGGRIYRAYVGEKEMEKFVVRCISGNGVFFYVASDRYREGTFQPDFRSATPLDETTANSIVRHRNNLAKLEEGNDTHPPVFDLFRIE
jgi:hypothetical protein